METMEIITETITWQEIVIHLNNRLAELNKKTKDLLEENETPMYREGQEITYYNLVQINKQLEKRLNSHKTFFDNHLKEYKLICKTKIKKNCVLQFANLSEEQKIAFIKCFSDELGTFIMEKIQNCPQAETQWKDKAKQSKYFYRIDLLRYLVEEAPDKPDPRDVL